MAVKRRRRASDVFRQVRIEGDCWIWTGTVHKDGYGVIKYNNKRMYTHLFMLKMLNGVDVPPGYEGDHLCRRRACCNPDHIEVVTKQENLRRRAGQLSPEQAKTIKTSSLSAEELAEQYNVTQAHVRRIKAGRRWRDVETSEE